MKFIYSIFFILLFSLSCSNESITPLDKNIALNKEFTATLSEKVTYEENDLSFHIYEINDSRCPTDAFCTWQGGARVCIEVFVQVQIIDSLNFSLGSNSNGSIVTADTVNFNYKSASYAAILFDVMPYPTISNATEPKSIKMKIISK